MRIALFMYFLLNGYSCFAQDWTFYGIFPAISQSGNLSEKLQYNLYLASTIDTFRQTVETKEYPATALQ